MRPSAAAAATALPSATALAAGAARSGAARRCSSEFHSPHSGHWPCHLRVSPPQEPQTNTGLARAIYAPSVEFQLGCAGLPDPNGVFCERGHSDRLAAMLAYDARSGTGKVTRFTVFGPPAVQG